MNMEAPSSLRSAIEVMTSLTDVLLRHEDLDLRVVNFPKQRIAQLKTHRPHSLPGGHRLEVVWKIMREQFFGNSSRTPHKEVKKVSCRSFSKPKESIEIPFLQMIHMKP